MSSWQNKCILGCTKDADLVDVAVEVPVGEGGCVLLPLALGVALVAVAEAGIDKKVDTRVMLERMGHIRRQPKELVPLS